MIRSRKEIHKETPTFMWGSQRGFHPIKVTREEYESLGCPERGVVLSYGFIIEKLGL